MEISMRVILLLILIVENAYLGGLKLLLTVVMQRANPELPLDRALVRHFASLATRSLLLGFAFAISLFFPGWSDAHLAIWFVAFSLSGAWAMWSGTMVWRALWNERLRAEWRAWRNRNR